eukprot:gb/GECH01003494.1/.p1 GENE.gb/GECH01003494.1/~~gb/GECH01003494.1/.p1  ORF type:complete len:131 (+),score=16.29 gb/GECH01003494.1/:1-393(+)
MSNYNEHVVKRCHGCNQTMMGMSVNALGKSYHPECLRCSQCHSIVKGSFVPLLNNDTQICCADCMPAAQNIDAESMGACDQCGKTISGGRAVSAMEGRRYHPECFRCCLCQDLIQGQFYRHGSQLKTSNG